MHRAPHSKARPGRPGQTACFATGAPNRRGAALVLISALMVILLAMTLFTVDVAYMQLTRSELRAATDAAAKAGAEALRRSAKRNDAVRAAMDVAAKNIVAGRPLNLRPSDIEVGRSVYQEDGTWKFHPNEQPYGAVRVNANLGQGESNEPVNLFFANIFGSGTFSPQEQSTAGQSEAEIALVIDRSHSMCWDLTGRDGSYPRRGSLLRPPQPGSRWSALRNAVDEFLGITQELSVPPRVSLITWASEDFFGLPVSLVDIDVPLTTLHSLIDTELEERTLLPMLGFTNISAGIDTAVEVLTGPDVKPYAAKVLILMTDGQWNEGRDPIQAAQDAADKGVIIHVVTLLPEADQPDMDQVAELTGGRRYHADNEQQLIEAFEEIARKLPLVFTD